MSDLVLTCLNNSRFKCFFSVFCVEPRLVAARSWTCELCVFVCEAEPLSHRSWAATADVLAQTVDKEIAWLSWWKLKIVPFSLLDFQFFFWFMSLIFLVLSYLVHLLITYCCLQVVKLSYGAIKKLGFQVTCCHILNFWVYLGLLLLESLLKSIQTRKVLVQIA